MVDKTQDKIPGVARVHEKIEALIVNNKNLEVNDLDLGDISRQLHKMPARNTDAVCRQTLGLMFDLAAKKMDSDDSKEVLANLRKLVGLVGEDMLCPKPQYMDTIFFPNKKNVDRIVKYIKKAKKTLIICIFTLTNDDLYKAVLDRHNNGVEVRVISDDECSQAKGSDIVKLAENGVAVRTDDAPTYHMHDKFMVVDSSFVMTGSFNWTYQAGSHN
jgi:mitochondrial cardiolipin hydrolase